MVALPPRYETIVRKATMELAEVRKQLDEIDAGLIALFVKRMGLAREVAAAKAQTGKAVFDPARERQKLLDVASRVPNELRPQAIALFSLLMSMNKAEQQKVLHAADDDSASSRALASLAPATEPWPVTATVACQGVEGAYSQQAACRLFDVPGITYFDSFEDVFRAVRDGVCEFGVLPIENSTAGSVNAVYDLLAKYRFTIVRSLRLKIDHNVLARPGTRLEDVREVLSHEQALAQCAGYLERHGIKGTVCKNTAMAAELVSQSDRTDLAALSSRSCAGLYGLNVFDADVQDSDNNYTRFVVISAKPKIYPGATRSSIMLTLEKTQPGALYRVLERIFALNINLVKLESRPIPGRDFDFVFYFDLECAPAMASFTELLDSLDDVCSWYEYFGSYTEVL